MMYRGMNKADSPSCCLWSGREYPRLNRKNGFRFTTGGRLGFKGRAPSGGRGLRSGVTWAEVFCRFLGQVVGDGAAAGLGAGDRGRFGPGIRALVPGSPGCLGIAFCSRSPICLTLTSAGWGSGLIKGGRGKETGLEGMDGIGGVPIGILTGLRPAIGGEKGVGDSL